MDEFELIERYFRPISRDVTGVGVGIGDDAAVLQIPPDVQLVVTTDTHVESVHFPCEADPKDVGFRSCATSLSDMAAMGATARWASLGLTMTRADGGWLEGFAAGAALALEQCGTDLVGGDTTRGPLVITWNIIGTVPIGAALLRSGASAGDGIYVSGTLGSSAAARESSLIGTDNHGEFERELFNRYWYPQPRIALATELRTIASSCIDISDGLIADLTHLARSSHCGAILECAHVPIAPSVLHLVGAEHGLRLALTGGDDYELCFTVPAEGEAALAEIKAKMGIGLTRIGHMVEGSQLQVIDRSGGIVEFDQIGYRHFE